MPELRKIGFYVAVDYKFYLIYHYILCIIIVYKRLYHNFNGGLS